MWRQLGRESVCGGLGWFPKDNPACKSPVRELCGQRAQDSAFPHRSQDAGPSTRRHFPFPALAEVACLDLQINSNPAVIPSPYNLGQSNKYPYMNDSLSLLSVLEIVKIDVYLLRLLSQDLQHLYHWAGSWVQPGPRRQHRDPQQLPALYFLEEYPGKMWPFSAALFAWRRTDLKEGTVWAQLCLWHVICAPLIWLCGRKSYNTLYIMYYKESQCVSMA